MTVGLLRALLAGKPDDMPIRVYEPTLAIYEAVQRGTMAFVYADALGYYVSEVKSLGKPCIALHLTPF